MKLFQSVRFEYWYSAALATIALLQTLFPKKVALGFIFLIIVTIVGAVKKQLIWKMNSVNILFIGLYITYLVGSFFTFFPSIASSYLEYKLSFILLPHLFLFRPKFEVPWKLPITAYLISLIIASLLGIIKVLQCQGVGNIAKCIEHFSYIHHPTYFAMYLMLGMALMFYGFKCGWNRFEYPYLVSFIVFATIMTALTMSLSAFFCFGLIAGGAGWFWVYKRFGFNWAFLGIFGLASILTIFVLATDLRSDFYYTYQSILKYLENPESFLYNANRYLIGNEVRLIMWTSAIILILEHPFGVGTGNVDYFLADKLESYGLHNLAANHYNPHNQYLQTFLEIGIVGILILLILLFYLIKYAVQNKNKILLLFVACFVFNCLFESILQRQSGIVFFTFWACALMFLPPILKKND